jgi:DNA primase
MIPDEVVERVRHEADIVAIVGEFVKLKRAGTSFRGPCPFHQGKHDNFAVTPRGGYVCFVCGEKGDLFTFVQKRLGLDFVESVKWVGARAGIEVREVSRAAEVADPREPSWEINAAAAAWFADRLWSDQSGGPAREYLAGRGLTRADAERFSLGWAPRDASALRDHLATLGFDPDRQLQAGLLVRRDGSAELRPRFHNRLIFPIADPAGHWAGFGGRLIGPGEPKYLNSGESEVFAKRTLLYGMHTARNAIRRADRVLVVEGYFDAIRLVLAGIEEVVAPLGTALTEEQSVMLRKYTRNVYLLYDSDKAGLKATFKAGDALLAVGASVQVVSLPAGEDPDTFVARAGGPALERALAQSVDVFDRKIQILERAGYFADLRRRREAVDKLLPTLRAASDPLTRDLYLTRAAEVSGASRDMLERELAREPDRPRRIEPPPAGPPADQDGPEPGSPRVRAGGDRRTTRRVATVAERELIRHLLHQRRYVESVGERVGSDSFTDPWYRAIYAALLDQGADAGIESLAAALEPPAVAVLQSLLEETGGLERADEVVAGSMNALMARELDLRVTEVERDIRLAQGDDQDALVQERERLLGELKALGRPRWKGFTSHR